VDQKKLEEDIFSLGSQTTIFTQYLKIVAKLRKNLSSNYIKLIETMSINCTITVAMVVAMIYFVAIH